MNSLEILRVCDSIREEMITYELNALMAIALAGSTTIDKLPGRKLDADIIPVAMQPS